MFPPPPAGSEGISRPDEIFHAFSEFWIYQLEMPWKTFKRRHLGGSQIRLSKSPLLPAFSVKEPLYPKLPADFQAPRSFSVAVETILRNPFRPFASTISFSQSILMTPDHSWRFECCNFVKQEKINNVYCNEATFRLALAYHEKCVPQ